MHLLDALKLVHHGINKDYKPAGYTVDTFSQDSKIVGEYSTIEGYFEADSKGRFAKIEKDITHALKHSGDEPPTRIYLVAREEEPPSFRAKFNESDLGKAHSRRTKASMDWRRSCRYS